MADSLARGALATSVATAIGRVTGFFRVVVVAGAMGTTFLANTYQTANTAPNLIFELFAAGVLTSVFVPMFVKHVVGKRDEGWAVANTLSSVALVVLVGLSLVFMLAAPLVMRLLTIGVQNDALRDDEIALGSRLLRLFAPQVIFYGVGMIMTAALHAHRKFVLAAAAPIANNIVVIGVYLTYAAMRSAKPPTVDGITDAETFVLGAGTTLGVIAMTVVLIPQLRKLGWRMRFMWQPRHPQVKKGVRLGAWALGYAGGYQAGIIVVLLLANRIEGGVAAYQWAFTFFYLPHAIFAVPIFNVLFTVMSEHAAAEDTGSVARRLDEGLAMLVFVLTPVAALFLAGGEPIAAVTLNYGVMTEAGAELVGRVLGAFALGLPAYSAFLIFTRAYYALGDTKTPTLVNALTIAIAGLVGAVAFLAASDEWAVAGLALGHTIGFVVGSLALGRALRSRITMSGASLRASIGRSLVAGCIALAVMLALRLLLPETSRLEALVNLAATTVAGVGVYAAVMAGMRSPEMRRVRGVVSGLRS